MVIMMLKFLTCRYRVNTMIRKSLFLFTSKCILLYSLLCACVSYAALEKGFYRDEGLNVVIRNGNPKHQPISEVFSGAAQYGEANAELLYHRLKGEPLVALASIFQHFPSVLLTLENSGIRSVHDLVGRKIMLVSCDNDADFLKQKNIAYNVIDPVSYSVDFYSDVFLQLRYIELPNLEISQSTEKQRKKSGSLLACSHMLVKEL